MSLLNLFNAVEAGNSENPVILAEYGVIVESSAAHKLGEIKRFLKEKQRTGDELNKTFHKSWEKVQESSREELYLHQILHYMTTYGTGFSSDFVYTPNEELDIPENKLVFKVIRGLNKDEILQRLLALLGGMALKEETVDEVLQLLVSYGHVFSEKDNIRNKEAIVKIADLHGVYPSNPDEFLRFLVFKSTGSAVLIKSEEAIKAIKSSTFNPKRHLIAYGLDRLASIFNRFKPIFLSWKGKCPSEINKISKLSKTLHKPMPLNALNLLTSKKFSYEEIQVAVDRGSIYHVFKALQALQARSLGQDTFTYRIRNGKSFTKENRTNPAENLENLKKAIANRLNLRGKTIYIPDNIEYSLPTSEKMFVGNIPTGTKVFGESLVAGVYWENSWGANDLDLSGISLTKIGWNSRYSGDGMTFSGDMTDATNGAVEYLHATKLSEPVLVLNNVYFGDDNAGYSLIVGNASEPSRKFMMNPNNRLLDLRTQMTQRQEIIGMFMPEENGISFTVLGFGAGNLHISRENIAQLSRKALHQQYRNPVTLKELISFCGGKIVKKDADFDLSLTTLTRDSFVNIFDYQRN